MVSSPLACFSTFFSSSPSSSSSSLLILLVTFSKIPLRVSDVNSSFDILLSSPVSILKKGYVRSPFLTNSIAKSITTTKKKKKKLGKGNHQCSVMEYCSPSSPSTFVCLFLFAISSDISPKTHLQFAIYYDLLRSKAHTYIASRSFF